MFAGRLKFKKKIFLSLLDKVVQEGAIHKKKNFFEVLSRKMDFMLLKTDAGLKFEGAFIRVRAAKILSFFNIISYLFYKVKSSCGWVSGKYI